MHLVGSLVQQCKHYILMHLEEFPVSHLSLLPLSTRRELLYQLPIADICLRLENTEFITGLDMATFWKSTWDQYSVGAADHLHDREDVKHFVQDKWDDTKYARATIYGVVASCAVGHILDMGFRCILKPDCGHDCDKPDKENEWGMSVVAFLYAVRKTYVHGHCKPEFPPRYFYKRNKSEEGLTMYEVENCFSHNRSEFPRIIPEFALLNDINLDHVYFLRNAVYLGIVGNPFEEQGLEFQKAVLKEATNLEVLILDHWGNEGEWEVKFFDEFCAFLSSCQAFLSRFRLLKIISSLYLNGFVVSRKNFNQLVSAYFAAPTDHVQKLHITLTKIKCSDVSFECSPTIEQRYRSFKTVQMGDCQFVSKYKATPKTISHWLGESINELPQPDPKPVEDHTYFFKVGDKSGGGPSRKRKHSELESEDHDQADS